MRLASSPYILNAIPYRHRLLHHRSLPLITSHIGAYHLVFGSLACLWLTRIRLTCIRLRSYRHQSHSASLVSASLAFGIAHITLYFAVRCCGRLAPDIELMLLGLSPSFSTHCPQASQSSKLLGLFDLESLTSDVTIPSLPPSSLKCIPSPSSNPSPFRRHSRLRTAFASRW